MRRLWTSLCRWGSSANRRSTRRLVATRWRVNDWQFKLSITSTCRIVCCRPRVIQCGCLLFLFSCFSFLLSNFFPPTKFSLILLNCFSWAHVPLLGTDRWIEWRQPSFFFFFAKKNFKTWTRLYRESIDSRFVCAARWMEMIGQIGLGPPQKLQKKELLWRARESWTKSGGRLRTKPVHSRLYEWTDRKS